MRTLLGPCTARMSSWLGGVLWMCFGSECVRWCGSRLLAQVHAGPVSGPASDQPYWLGQMCVIIVVIVAVIGAMLCGSLGCSGAHAPDRPCLASHEVAPQL